jgi:trimeric autotransporter adhesin
MHYLEDLQVWSRRRDELIRAAENEHLLLRPGRRGAVAALVVTILLLMLVAAGPAPAATTFTVNSVSDAADTNLTDSFCDANPLPQVELCTLRAAIQEANDTPGTDAINFNISGTGVKTISPSSELPAITGAVTVDGYTQPGASPNTSAKGTNARLLVELDGSGAGISADGLVINASNVIVKGLVINGFDSDNIRIISTDVPTNNNTVEGNFIGTDPSGTQGGLGQAFGVEVLDGENNILGGTSPASRNLISGNGADGIFTGTDTTGTRVQGNLIGTERDGKSPLGNADEGVDIEDAEGAAVGGATRAAANTIAFNEDEGVLVTGRSTLGSPILGNSIFSNGGVGIDLSDDGFADGPTDNDPADADPGPNGLQNKPVITSARASGRATAIKGKLNSTPGDAFTIQLFSNPAGDAEGRKFLGQKTVTTGASGDASFSFKKKVRGGIITATATNDATGDTSEFSAPRRVRRA